MVLSRRVLRYGCYCSRVAAGACGMALQRYGQLAQEVLDAGQPVSEVIYLLLASSREDGQVSRKGSRRWLDRRIAWSLSLLTRDEDALARLPRFLAQAGRATGSLSDTAIGTRRLLVTAYLRLRSQSTWDGPENRWSTR